ncbi:MAG TPA: hypothetical protein ENK55_04375 [Actinobacteria bacterium]|nr:hypothetical protein [Actinomycetota bacterium]
MCCLVAAASLVGPRLAILLWWLVDQVRWRHAFPNFLWAFVGFLFAPWTTLFYVLVAPGGLYGFDFVWLGIGILVDLSSYGSSAYSRSYRT